jgi:DNA adenine methylase
MKSLFDEEVSPQVVNVASVPHRSPFRYPGGKTWLVPIVRRWLKSLPGKPAMLGEPFAGGAIVGLSALFDDLIEGLALVELDENVASVWETILNGKAKQLAQRILDFKISKQVTRKFLSLEPKTVFDRAFFTILRNRVQRGGIMAPGATLMRKGENGKGVASRWYPQTLSKRIGEIAKRRNKIIFIPGDGIAFIRANAHRRDMVFFIDPPYTVAGRRLYVHSEIDHEELFRETARIKGDFLMSYDKAEPIKKLAKRFGLSTCEVPMKNTHHAVMSEVLIGRKLDWINAEH